MARIAVAETVTGTEVIFDTSADGTSPVEVWIECDSGSAAPLLVHVAGLHGPTSAEPVIPLVAGIGKSFALASGIGYISAKGSGGTATYTMYPTAQ